MKKFIVLALVMMSLSACTPKRSAVVDETDSTVVEMVADSTTIVVDSTVVE